MSINIIQLSVPLIKIGKRDKKLSRVKHIVSSQDFGVAGLLYGTDRLGKVIGVYVKKGAVYCCRTQCCTMLSNKSSKFGCAAGLWNVSVYIEYCNMCI